MTRKPDDEYRDNTGHDPPVDDTPDRWQWSYSGTRAEREDLLERMRDESDDTEPHPDQMTLG